MGASYDVNDITVNVPTPECIQCGKPGIIVMPFIAFINWQFNKVYIQIAWPEGTAAEREQLINGVHGPCFDELFPAGQDG